MLFTKLQETIKPISIDSEGTFKYIQILIEPADPNDKNTGSEKYLIVRGWQECAFHADVLEKFQYEEMQNEGELNFAYTSSCPGGGRISHDPETKNIVIYGYSQGFGRADHSETQKIV